MVRFSFKFLNELDWSRVWGQNQLSLKPETGGIRFEQLYEMFKCAYILHNIFPINFKYLLMEILLNGEYIIHVIRYTSRIKY